MKHFTNFYLKFKFIVLVNRVSFLLNAAFSMVILDLISQVHLLSYVDMLPKYLKHSTFSAVLLFVINWLLGFIHRVE